MILYKFRVLREHRTLSRFFHVRLQLHQSVFPGIDEDVAQHLQLVEVKALAVTAGPEDAHGAFGHFDDHSHRIRDEHRTDGGASNDDKLGRLHQDHQLAVLHHVSTDDGPDYED